MRSLPEERMSEAQRKILHLLLGVGIVAGVLYNILTPSYLFVILMVGIVVSFLSKKRKLPFISYFLKRFDREKDLKKFPGKGVIFYLIGSFLVLSLFPQDVALAAIMVLALGDAASHAFGVRFGKLKHPFSDKKFLEGLVAGIVAGSIGAFLFLPWYEALIAAFFAMLAEGMEIKLGAEEVDDNVIVPVVAAIAVSLIRFVV